ITAAPPKTRIWESYRVEQPDGKEIELKRDRIFIPSSVFDNPALLRNNPEYLASLAMMSEAEKRALLYGDWDCFRGQVFSEWRDDPAGYETRRWSHVIKPFPIPEHWKIIRGFDFGFSRPFSVGWYAVDEKGVLYRIAEYYGCTGVANEGVKLNPKEIAAGIREMESTHELLKGKKITGVADPSIFEKSRGESIADQMEEFPYFIAWEKGDNTRLPGKMQFHYRLAFDDEGRSMFYCFDTCKHFLRTIPNLVYDETKVEDIDTDGEDHIYDECRYVFMTHPITPRKTTPKLVPLEDPLELFGGEKEGNKYKFYRL
ncbi:MAG: Terminase-like family protein, partial [Anaerotignum sp.]